MGVDDDALFDVEEGGEYPDDKTQSFVTPYADRDGFTAGHAGDGASRDRAQGEVADGTVSRRQLATLDWLIHRKRVGSTWKELATEYGWHHGQASGVLSVLHKESRIACLTDRRDGCSIYVMPHYVDDRTTVEHRGTRASEDRAAVARVRHLLSLYPDSSGSIPVRFLRDALEGR